VRGRLLISDANILIDMNTGGLLRSMFKLDGTIAVPNTLFDEELRQHHPELPRLGLKSLELGGDAVKYADWLVTQYSVTGASINDLLALALAWQEKCPLLTGDARLRDIGRQESVEVHGTLWLVGQMVDARVIVARQAAAAYCRMREAGRRLPWKDVEEQLRAFGK
jgi:predicted nucleic acid-binding protein